MALIDLLTPLLNKIKQALGPFGKLFDLVSRFFSNVKNLYSKSIALGSAIRNEIIAWKNFREAIPYRTGVISIPAAIERSTEFKDQLVSAWHSIVDLIQQIREQLNVQEDPAVEAKEAIADIERSGFSQLLSKFPRLIKGAEKVLVWVGVVVNVLEEFITFVDDVTEIVAAITALREEVETASTIFLSQKNPRRVVRLEDGTSMKIRVGNLHE